MLTAEMIERAKPILFNTEMVRAIIGNKKTQTRRVATGKPKYAAGDVLYVRETWCFMSCIDCVAETTGNCHWEPIVYEDTDSISSGCFLYRASVDTDSLVWRPSIHMPKCAARIFLEVTEVRTERLQNIKPLECVQEGADADALALVGENFVRGMFSSIWDSTISKEQLETCGWAANPTVDVYTFKVLKK